MQRDTRVLELMVYQDLIYLIPDLLPQVETVDAGLKTI